MNRTAHKIYCDNEHGIGDGFVTFPEHGDYVDGTTVRELRRRAKAAGWYRTRRNDFCPLCGIDQLDISEDKKEDLRLKLERDGKL